MPIPPDTRALIAALVDDLTPVRPLPSPWIRFARSLAAGALLVGVGVALLGTPSDWWQMIDQTRVTTHLGIELVSGVLAALVAFLLSVPDSSRLAAVRWLPVAAVAAWVLFLANQLAREEWLIITGASIRNADACLSSVVAVAALPAALSLAMILRAAPLQPAWSGGLVTAGAAGLAGFAVHFHCLNLAPTHALVSHVGPVLGLGMVGAIAGYVWQRAASTRVRRRIRG